MKQGIDKGLESGFGFMHYCAQGVADLIAHTEGVTREHTNVNGLTASEITAQRKHNTAVKIEMTSLVAKDMMNRLKAKMPKRSSNKEMRLVGEFQTFNRINYDI